MSNKWQDRRDIDQIKWLADELERIFTANGVSNFKELLGNYYDQSEVDQVASKLDTDLNNLSESLDELDESLQGLSEDSSGLSDDLDDLKSKLLTSQGQLEVLNVDLGALSSSLTTLDGDFDTLEGALNDLNSQLNGDNGLASQLSTLSSQLDSLQDSNDDLLASLNNLSGYLVAYSGTLAQFKSKLQTELGNTEYAKLNEDTIELVYAIANSKNAISNSQSSISSLNTAIGDTTQITGSVVSNINSTSSAIDTVKTDLWGSGGTASTPITNSVKANINQVKDTDIPAINSTIGEDTDDKTDGTLYGLINGSIDDIGTVQGDISQVQGDISDVQGDITNVQGDISDLESAVGTVNLDVNDDLQTQILKLIISLSDLVSFVNFVDSITDASIGTFYDSNDNLIYEVSPDYPYDYIYDSSTQRYYQVKWYGDKIGWEYSQQSPLYSRFTSTSLYGVLSQLFSLDNHTHTKSNITDFTHQHTSFDLTDSPYRLVQIIPTIMVLIKVYSNGWNVYITYENTEGNSMVLGSNTSYAFPTKIEEPYRPLNRYVYANLTHQGNMAVYGAVNWDGAIYIINRSTATSFNVFGSISYPLKAKMISASGDYSHIVATEMDNKIEISPSTSSTSSITDSATFFGQLTDGTNPVTKQNEDLGIYKDNSIVSSSLTDENGLINYSYTANGSGVHTIYFQHSGKNITSNTVTITDWLLADNAIDTDYNDTIYYNYNNRNRVDKDPSGTTLTAITGSNGIFVLNPTGTTSTTLGDYNYFDSFTLEFDFISRQGTSLSTNVTLYLADSSARSVAFHTLGINSAGHCKIVYNGSTLKVEMDGVETYNQSITGGTKRVGFATGTSSQGGFLKFKNLRIY